MGLGVAAAAGATEPPVWTPTTDALLAPVATVEPTPRPLSAADAKHYGRVFSQLGRKRLGKALKLSEQGDQPQLQKVVRWYYLYNAGSGARFHEIVDFLETNPHWPYQDRLRRHAENVIKKSTPVDRVLSYFRRYPPLTTVGRERYAAALRRTGDAAAADDQIRQAWVEARFYGRRGYAQQKRFLRRHRNVIGAADHFARAERLLWIQRVSNAYRYLRFMSPKDRAVVTAWGRLLRRNTPKSKIREALRNLPKDGAPHPGPLYAEMRRYTKAKRNDPAREILHRAPAGLGNPEAWWIQRNIQARRALEEHDHEEAYRLASNHGLVEGKYFAEAEFLSGWIALRLLKIPEIAEAHFGRLQHAAQYPIDTARAAYWLARTNEVLGQTAEAAVWYEKAARYMATYYGQQAALRLSPGARPALPPPADAAQRSAFERNELVRVVRMLDAVSADRFEAIFLRQIQNNVATSAERALASELALETGNRVAAVSTARAAHKVGDPLVPSGYPVLDVPPVKSRRVEAPEEALLLAVIRQESQFNERARSGAGARGLMQLMPRTALLTARKLRVRYVRSKLTRDPAYNIRLGRAYLSGLLRAYDGHYALALAAYNAGPNRVNRWVRRFGDPRSGAIDVIDWVELIPFRETRGYVQRVLENLQVYRWRLGKSELIPAQASDIYTAMGAETPVLANGPSLIPAAGFIDLQTELRNELSGQPGAEPGDSDNEDELGDDAKARSDEALDPTLECDPELPMSNPGSC